MFGELSWTCHICGKERPDKNISVYQSPLIVNGVEIGEQNVRYCNDNPECIKGAKDIDFFKDE